MFICIGQTADSDSDSMSTDDEGMVILRFGCMRCSKMAKTDRCTDVLNPLLHV